MITILGYYKDLEELIVTVSLTKESLYYENKENNYTVASVA